MPKTLQEWIANKTADDEIGTIPLDRAGICWDLERNRTSKPVLDFHVVDLERARRLNSPEARIWDQAGSTLGACMGDWREGRDPRHTPLGRFAEMGFDGDLPSGKDFARVLKEFAKIEGADWAAHMLAALRMGQRIDDNDDEWTM